MRISLASLLMLWVPVTNADAVDPYLNATGPTLMETVYDKHQQYPWVYEEQSMIMIDQLGYKNTRKLRRYSRVDEEANAHFLLLFDSPAEVEGVALLALRSPDGETKQVFYLPAFGRAFINSVSSGTALSESFLDTDFAIGNLVGERLDDHRYERRPDEVTDETDYYVVDSYDEDQTGGSPQRRHYIRKDNLFIDRTDHFDDLGRIRKRQTQHDLVNVHGDMWRANMMMMDDLHLGHRTVIKIDKRIFSADYVPEEVFTRTWILENQPPPEDSMPEVADRD